ncbi:MAG: hypothetical protein ACRC42_02280 [Mycoplasma sp.]
MDKFLYKNQVDRGNILFSSRAIKAREGITRFIYNNPDYVD